MATPTFSLEQTPINSIRSLPPDTYLIHATNCIAEWGAGIAAELAQVFPAACREYKNFCEAAKTDASSRWPPRTLAGRCLIIPPQDADVAAGAPRIHIVCVFTSYGYGRPNDRTGKPGKDNSGKILVQTLTALKDLRAQLDNRTEAGADVVLYSPMFNSGAFRVPWEKTVALIDRSFAGWGGRWLVMAPP
ncbi:hypothetical protein B0J13DRAFT_645053 [Dactylonectria estremocensis]|uniref:ADP-ribose 1''-phosphate phosphatase n=1 Tax=Dactylonectria estremocensis TaxID=1079267 RepID=A0A9P9E3B8_9HYPO|nr:hypothetical protein B0J13DRAFT_645053 [Dactylonectria estremocensis]